MVKFLFVHSWSNFSLAEWCLREAITRECSIDVDFLSISIQPGVYSEQERFFQVLSTFRPEFIGFSCFYWNFDFFRQITAGTKTLYPETIIILGGPQVNSKQKCNTILRSTPSVDYIIRGPGERALSKLLENQNSEEGHNKVCSISGLSFRTHDNIHHNPLLMQRRWQRGKIFHWCNHELSELLSYQTVVSYETLRGCRFSCSYCQYPVGGLDMLNLDLVFEELAYLCAFSIPHIRICDAHFGGSQARAKAILKKLAQLNHNSSIKIYTDLSHVDDEYLTLVNDANAIITSIGIQTTQSKSLKKINRPMLHRLKKPIQMILDKFPDTPADVIVGLPGDDNQGVRHTYEDILKLGFSKVNVFRLSAFPGTPLTENLTYFMNEAIVCGDCSQVISSDNFPPQKHTEVVKLTLSLEIIASFREVKQRLGNEISLGYLLGFFSGLDADDLLKLYNLIFKLPPQSLLNQLRWIGEIIPIKSHLSAQFKEALISDLLFQQYHNCVRQHIYLIKNITPNGIRFYDRVVYHFRNGGSILWDLNQRSFFLNPPVEILNNEGSLNTWHIDPKTLTVCKRNLRREAVV